MVTPEKRTLKNIVGKQSVELAREKKKLSNVWKVALLFSWFQEKQTWLPHEMLIEKEKG